jgi:hypothetical protein
LQVAEIARAALGMEIAIGAVHAGSDRDICIGSCAQPHLASG